MWPILRIHYLAEKRSLAETNVSANDCFRKRPGTSGAGHQRTVAVTFELVALSDAERPVFGEQFEGGNFENRPEAEIRADLEIRGHQSDF